MLKAKLEVWVIDLLYICHLSLNSWNLNKKWLVGDFWKLTYFFALSKSLDRIFWHIVHWSHWLILACIVIIHLWHPLLNFTHFKLFLHLLWLLLMLVLCDCGWWRLFSANILLMTFCTSLWKYILQLLCNFGIILFLCFWTEN